MKPSLIRNAQRPVHTHTAPLMRNQLPAYTIKIKAHPLSCVCAAGGGWGKRGIVASMYGCIPIIATDFLHEVSMLPVWEGVQLWRFLLKRAVFELSPLTWDVSHRAKGIQQ